MITWGLDTSHWEGTSLPIIDRIIGKTGKVNNQLLTMVSFKLAYQAGARFVLIKATDGIDTVDPAWEDSYVKAIAANLFSFPYHFYEQQDPYQQADWFSSNIFGRFNGVATVDYEVTPKDKTKVLHDLVQIGVDLKADFHETPLLYTSPYYLSLLAPLDLTPLLVYNLWLAWWNPGFITSCYPWAGYLARQWTDRGKLPGVQSSVDLDYMLDTPQEIVNYSKT